MSLVRPRASSTAQGARADPWSKAGLPRPTRAPLLLPLAGLAPPSRKGPDGARQSRAPGKPTCRPTSMDSRSARFRGRPRRRRHGLQAAGVAGARVGEDRIENDLVLVGGILLQEQQPKWPAERQIDRLAAVRRVLAGPQARRDCAADLRQILTSGSSSRVLPNSSPPSASSQKALSARWRGTSTVTLVSLLDWPQAVFDSADQIVAARAIAPRSNPGHRFVMSMVLARADNSRPALSPQ
jgi:hypothetical protein